MRLLLCLSIAVNSIMFGLKQDWSTPGVSQVWGVLCVLVGICAAALFVWAVLDEIEG